MNLHFDELYGNNSILLNENQDMNIYISDLIENTCCIEIYAKKVILDNSLEHFNNYLKKDQKYFFKNNIENNQSNSNKLLISTQGLLILGKKSWADNIRTSLGISLSDVDTKN